MKKSAKSKRERKAHKPTEEEELCNKKLIDKIKILQAKEYTSLKMNERLPLVNLLESADCIKLKCKHDNTYLYGSYTKESREVSQVRWLLDQKRKVLPITV